MNVQDRSYRFALDVIQMVGSLPRESASRIIGDQLLRSATSIGANIIEAQAASSQKDFINFLSYALKSANETKYWLGLLRDSGRKDGAAVNPLLEDVKQLSNILVSSILTLKRKQSK